MMYMWLCIIIILVVIEFATADLTTVWFILSGILALVVSYFTDNLVLQVGIFTIVGLLLLLTTRKAIKKFVNNMKQEKTNIDRIIGMKGIVTERIMKSKIGEVKVDGKYWRAYSDEICNEDDEIEILEINSVKLKVKKVSE